MKSQTLFSSLKEETVVTERDILVKLATMDLRKIKVFQKWISKLLLDLKMEEEVKEVAMEGNSKKETIFQIPTTPDRVWAAELARQQSLNRVSKGWNNKKRRLSGSLLANNFWELRQMTWTK